MSLTSVCLFVQVEADFSTVGFLRISNSVIYYFDMETAFNTWLQFPLSTYTTWFTIVAAVDIKLMYKWDK